MGFVIRLCEVHCDTLLIVIRLCEVHCDTLLIGFIVFVVSYITRNFLIYAPFRVLTSRRMRLVQYIARKREMRYAYKILGRKRKERTPLERPRRLWEDNI
jgi:hypothetical protein